MKYLSGAAVALVLCGLAQFAMPHDTWLQTNTSVVRVGDAVHVDLMLGNHGNEHRDFKVAGKFDPSSSKIQIIDPAGKAFDLLPSFTDQGYAPKEGFYSASFQPTVAGLYLIAQSSEQVVTYAPERVVRSAKAFFLAAQKLDELPADTKGFDRVLGHGLELIPQANPVAPMGPGVHLKVQLLYKGKPLAGETISFIPRGQVLKPGFDAEYERKTDENGIATFEPKAANYYLVAAHHTEPAEKGQGYESTKYSSTLTVLVPALCPCCGD